MGARKGTVYLLHLQDRLGNLDNPRAQAQHYIGYCESRRFDSRMAEHSDGSGARMLAAARRRGIGFVVARTWKGTREDERALKNHKKARDFCPICKAQAHADQLPIAGLAFSVGEPTF